MVTIVRRVAFGALLLLGLLAVQGAARAQFVTGFNPYGGGYANPYMGQQQYMYNLQMARGAYANSMGYANSSYALPYAQPAYNPYLAYGVNPYSTLPGGAGANPYSPGTAATDPYTNPYSNPYMFSPYGYGSGMYNSPGFTLMGSADVLRSYGSVITKQEEARILREKALQEQVRTKKDEFDLRMYIRANTPSWSEEQARVAKLTLKRIQNNSSPAEVSTGRSLNYLLDDVRKYQGKDKDLTFSKIELPEDILNHLNVTTKNNGLGVLRDNGKIVWPSALLDIAQANTRKEMETRAKTLVENAAKGTIDRNALRDLTVQVEDLRNQLTRKSNEIQTGKYLDAKRYLNDLDDALAAVEGGEAKAQFDYQKLVNEGKIADVNTLITTMVTRGWRFAPSTAADEAAYRALHSALSAYDVALNTQAGE